ncbi:MAG: hypothetical protein WBS17_09135 [Candidatus Acidiferrales bacterium]
MATFNADAPDDVNSGEIESEEKIEFLVITNTIHPYQVHNISVLSLLPGSTYRFRYESDYFQMNPSELTSLTGKYGLLVLRDFERAKFIPLRSFRCFRVEPCGEFIFLELEFLSFVEFESVGRIPEAENDDTPERRMTVLERQLQGQAEREKYSSVIEKIVAEQSLTNKPSNALEKLIIPCAHTGIEAISIDDRSDHLASVSFWSRIVALLGGITSYRKACFYLLGSIRDLDSGNETKTFASAWRKGYKLYAKRGYALQVFQLMADGTPPRAPGLAMNVTTLGQHILPMRSTERVDGAYDRLEFYFSVLPETQRRTQSVLMVQCDQKLPGPEGGDDSVPIPASLTHIQIKWTKREFVMRRILSPCLFVLGVTAWFYSAKISDYIAHGLKLEQVQLVALFLLGIAVHNWGVFTDAFKATPGPKA